MKNKITVTEALKLLEAMDLAEEAMPNSENATVLNEEESYSHDYDSYIQETNDKVNQEILEAGSIEAFENAHDATLQETVSSDNHEPAIGDIAILKIKLNSSHKNKKYLYNGYERRPVLVIKSHDNLIDGVEITHSSTFQNKALINIGKLGKDSIDSYANIFVPLYNLDASYEFPIEFKDGQPITKGEYALQYFGQIYKGKDGDEPFLVDFDYNANYKEKLNLDLVISILTQLKKATKR